MIWKSEIELVGRYDYKKKSAEWLIDWKIRLIEWCLRIVRGIENETAEDFNEGKTNKNSFWEPNQHLFIYCNHFFFNHLISLLVNLIWKILSFVVLSKCIKTNKIILKYTTELSGKHFSSICTFKCMRVCGAFND